MKTDQNKLKTFCEWYRFGGSVLWYKEMVKNSTQEKALIHLESDMKGYIGIWNEKNKFDKMTTDDVPEMAKLFIASIKK